MALKKLIKLKDVMAMTGMSRSAIYQSIIDSDFPKQVRLGSRSVAWEEGEIQAWIQKMLDERRGSSPLS